MLVKGRNMEDRCNSQGTPDIVGDRMHEYKLVKPFYGGHDILRSHAGCLLEGVLSQIESGSVPDVIEAGHEDSVYGQGIPMVCSFPYSLQSNYFGPRDCLNIAVEWVLVFPAPALQVLDP